MNQKKLKIAGVILVIVLLAIVLYFTSNNKGNSVVYLSTGEVYIGELSTFPVMELKNGYILTTVQDPTDPKKSNFQLNPLTEALWSPKNLYINKKHVVFYGPILENSKIGETLANKK